MITPLVTIAIPAFKTNFIAETIESALSQTYGNIEVIVVDDASPYNIADIVEAHHDNRLTYYRNESNLGKGDPSANWNRCMDIAKGEFICILCDDDLYDKDYITEMIALATKYPYCNAFRSGVKEIDSNGTVIELYPLAPEYEGVDELIWHRHSNNGRQTLSEWMFRKEVLCKIGGFFSTPMAWGADCATVFLIAKDGGIVSSPKRMTSFRRSKENITGQQYCHIPEKIIGWRKQCDIALKVIEASNSPYKKIITNVINKDKKQGTKLLIKQAGVKNLILMTKDRQKYGLNIRMLLNGLWRNLMWKIHVRSKQ